MTVSQSVRRTPEFALVPMPGAPKSGPLVALRPKAVTRPAYTTSARVLHWITAVLVFLTIPLGIIIANDWGGRLQDSLYNLHRAIGLVLIPIVLLRLVGGRVRPPAALPIDIPSWQRTFASLTHACLYVLLLLQPLMGWMVNSAYGAPTSVLGWFDLPAIFPEGRAAAEQLSLAHTVIGGVLAVLVAGHVAGALYHHFVRRDGVLMRMLRS